MKNLIEGIISDIVVSFCTSCIKFVEYQLNQERRGQPDDDRKLPQPENSAPFTPPKSITVALCLVVPAYIVSNIKDQYPIDVYQIEQLIDKSSYFLCTQFAEADYIQNNLDFTDESVLNIAEQREVYIRINIPNGQNLIGKISTYILKRNLPSNAQGVVRQIACLNNLSGLEKFNRV